MKTEFHVLNDPINLTQYIRGKLFIYVDFLMSHEFESLVKDIPEVISFLKTVIQLIAQWIVLFPQYIQSANYLFTFLAIRLLFQ